LRPSLPERRFLLAAALLAAWALQPHHVHAQRVTLAPPSPPRLQQPAASDIGLGSAHDPELDYVLNCQGCHRADGSGTPGAIPELAGHMARFLWASGGREYLARVPGVAQSTLDDASLAQLLNWMLLRFDAGAMPGSFEPFSAAEVAALRREPLVRVSETRRALLQAIAGMPAGSRAR